MAMTKQTKFIIAIAVQLAIIFAVIIFKVTILTGGTEIVLRVEPIDPRDLLRGDYATFQYNISNLDSYLAKGQQLRNNDTVYVSLRKSGKYWAAQSIQKTKPGNNEIFIKGRVVSGGTDSQFNPLSLQRFTGSRFHIIYGVEEYFIPEGKGNELNSLGRVQEALARVVVDGNGNAVLKQLYINNKPWP